MSISLKRKKIFQKEKRHSSVLGKAFQISTKKFSLHRHFKETNDSLQNYYNAFRLKNIWNHGTWKHAQVGMGRDRSSLVENTFPFNKPNFSCGMEHSLFHNRVKPKNLTISSLQQILNCTCLRKQTFFVSLWFCFSCEARHLTGH